MPVYSYPVVLAQIRRVHNYVWNVGTLSWDAEVQPSTTGGGGGGTVDQGVAGSDPWVVKFSTPQNVIVDSASLGTVAVSGPLTDTQLRASAVPVSGTFFQVTQPVSIATMPSTPVTGPLTDTQLRATRVPVDGSGVTQPVSGTFWQTTQPISAATLPLPTNAATAALQTQPGVDIGDVTVNNGAGASAVNIQDGGNTITVDGSVSASVTGSVSVSNMIAAVETGLAKDSSLSTLHTDLTGGGAHTIIDSGAVTVSQSTATNLKTQAEAYQGGSAVSSSNPLQVSLANTGSNATAVSISGTVTANAGTNLNTSTLALESGGNLDSLVAKDFATSAQQNTLIADLVKLLVAQGSATSTQVGPMVQATVQDSLSALTMDTLAPLSLTQEGRLRVQTVNETNNFTPWGSSETWGDNGMEDCFGFSAW